MNTTTAHMQPIHPETSGYSSILLILGAWFLVALAASLGGIFAPVDGALMFSMPLAIAVPIVIFAAAYRLSSRVRERLLAIDTRWLVLLHTWRMVGLGFLMLYAVGALPAVFAFPAGIGDAASAAWALAVGIGLYGGFRVSRRHLLAWNAFGFADFIIAVTIGLASRYGSLQAIPDDVTTYVMGQLPLALIPSFIVPLLAITHIIIYLQARNGREVGTRRDTG